MLPLAFTSWENGSPQAALSCPQPSRKLQSSVSKISFPVDLSEVVAEAQRGAANPKSPSKFGQNFPRSMKE